MPMLWSMLPTEKPHRWRTANWIGCNYFGSSSRQLGNVHESIEISASSWTCWVWLTTFNLDTNSEAVFLLFDEFFHMSKKSIKKSILLPEFPVLLKSVTWNGMYQLSQRGGWKWHDFVTLFYSFKIYLASTSNKLSCSSFEIPSYPSRNTVNSAWKSPNEYQK